MQITEDQAFELLRSKVKNENLFRHGLAAKAVMRALARKLGGDEQKWGVVGLLHDGDYEETKDTPERHAVLMAQWLSEMGEDDEELLHAVRSHNFAHTGDNPPESQMAWAMYCCDELTGFIVAVALVRPDKKLSSVTVESVLKKFPQKDFASSVNRKQIELCEEKLNIPLPEFVGIALSAMQEIAAELEL